MLAVTRQQADFGRVDTANASMAEGEGHHEGADSNGGGGNACQGVDKRRMSRRSSNSGTSSGRRKREQRGVVGEMHTGSPMHVIEDTWCSLCTDLMLTRG